MSDKTPIKDTVFLLRSIKSGYSMHNVFLPIINFMHAPYYEAPCERADIKSLMTNLKWVRKVASTKGINHMTGGYHYLLLAIPFQKNVLTIHDLVLLRNSKGLKRFIFKLLWFKLPIMCSKMVTCITNTTRQELLSAIHMNPQKAVTVYNPVSPLYQYTEHLFNKSCPRILHIGTAWNKNTENVIASLKGITCKIVIVGELSDSISAALRDCNIQHEILHDLSNEELYQQYQLADIISFPSIYEGFGMPIIEGQATGRPVLTSNIPPMTEVAGNGACFVNPRDIDSMRKGFLRIINDDEYRNQLVREGIENAKRFALGTIVEQYHRIYEKL